MKHHIVIYGCQMNRSDAERIDGLLQSLGSQKTDDPASADIIVTVMCSVRQMAADRVFGLHQKIAFAKLKKDNPRFKSVLTGCIVDADRPRFAEIFDYLLDIKDLSRWPEILGLTKKTDTYFDYFHILPKHTLSFSVFIPISKGCDNYCTYCVVPYTRGRLESRPINDIIKEARLAVRNGTKEIWLLGQNVNNYHYKNFDFAQLLRQINDIPGNFWIRFTSPHPKDFDNNAILAMAQCQKVTPYLNLPIQSGDNTVLKAMGRPYTVAKYKTLAKDIRQAFKTYRHDIEKEIALSTDVIVGFPGETKNDFAATVRLFRDVKFDMAYIAAYSPRPGTAAAQLRDDATLAEKKRRYKALTRIVAQTAKKRNAFFLNKTVDVLVDRVTEKNSVVRASGKTRHYKTVVFDAAKAPLKPGNIVNVMITKVMAFGLYGCMR